jgi:hypothetical protein
VVKVKSNFSARGTDDIRQDHHKTSSASLFLWQFGKMGMYWLFKEFHFLYQGNDSE